MSWFPGECATKSESKDVVELKRGVRATPARGLGVGVTGLSLPYGHDSIENRDLDGEYSCGGLYWNRKKEIRLLAPEVQSLCLLPIVEDSS